MKNAINHLVAQRLQRPREQHLKVDTRKIEEIIKDVNDQVSQINKLENEVNRLHKVITDQQEQIRSLEVKLARKEKEEVAVV